jgi:hypothetical protein
MIISDKEKFVFVHIPKCAGTSVRSRIEHLDDRSGAYSGRLEQHPELGLLNYVHLPLQTLYDHFPAEFECIKSYRSVAVLRDPSKRFVSSIAQYCNRYTNTDIRSHTRETLRKEVRNVIDALEGFEDEAPGARLPAELIHFQRQRDYTHILDRQIIDHLVEITHVEPMLLSLLGAQALRGDAAIKANESRVYRSAGIQVLASVGRRLAPGLGAWLPGNLSKWVRDNLYSPLNHQFEDVFEDEIVRNFIASYYARDITLFNEARPS